MPTVNFVGEIESTVMDVEELSVTWAVVPGSLLTKLVNIFVAFLKHIFRFA